MCSQTACSEPRAEQSRAESPLTLWPTREEDLIVSFVSDCVSAKLFSYCALMLAWALVHVRILRTYATRRARLPGQAVKPARRGAARVKAPQSWVAWRAALLMNRTASSEPISLGGEAGDTSEGEGEGEDEESLPTTACSTHPTAAACVLQRPVNPLRPKLFRGLPPEMCVCVCATKTAASLSLSTCAAFLCHTLHSTRSILIRMPETF